MTSVHARKPRNVRSVYARPRSDQTEENIIEPSGEGQDKSTCWSEIELNQKSSRLKNRGQSSTADKNALQQLMKRSIDVGNNQKRSSGGKKSKKGGDDGPATTAENAISRRSSAATKTKRVRAGIACTTSENSVPKESSAATRLKRGRAGGLCTASESSVNKKSSALSKTNAEEVVESSTSSESDNNKGSSVPVKTNAAECVDAATTTDSGVGKEAFVSTNTLSLLKRKIQENKEVANEPVNTDSDAEDQCITKLKPYVCGVCQRRYGSDISLREHERIHWKQETAGASSVPCPEREELFNFKCDVCNKAFKLKSTLMRHMPVHDEVKPFVCDICGKSFSQAQHLEIHLFQHKGERPFACDVCDKTYLRNFDLQQHKRTHTGEKPYSCNICGKAFTRMDYLKHHRQIHFSTEPADAKPYKCDECSQTFRKSEYLKFHKQRRHADVILRPFVCELCYKAFKSKGVLKKHMRIHTRKKDPLLINRGVSCKICEICGAKFQKKTGFRLHMMTHTGERPHTCEVCSKGFITKHQWLVHRRLHTGERPFVCQMCSAAYRSKERLQYHIDAFHFDKRPHICDVCNRAFKSRKILKDHKMIHLGIKPHICGECGKCFTQSSQLKNHARTHTGEKPYPCKYCPKSFGSSGARTRHTRMHTGEKPCKCSECPAVFTRSEYCKHHLEKVHGISVAKSVTTADPSAANTDWPSSSLPRVHTEGGLHSTASHSSGNYSCPGNVSSQPVVVVPQPEVFEGRASNQEHDDYAGPLLVVQSEDDTVSNPVSDIPSAPTVVVESAENLQDCVGSRAAEGLLSVKEHCVYTPGMSVICQPLPSTYSYSHISSDSEVIECSVVDHPDNTQSQFICEEHASGSVTVEPQVDRSKEVMPTIIEVQVRRGRKGMPPKVIEVKHDGTVTHSLSGVESETEHEEEFPSSPTEEVEVETAQSETGLAVAESHATSHGAESETAHAVIESPASSHDAKSVVGRAVIGSQIVCCDIENVANRAVDKFQGGFEKATFSAVREWQNSCCDAETATGLTVTESQVYSQSTATLAVSQSDSGHVENAAAVTVLESQAGAHCPAEYFQVYQSDGTESLTIIESQTAFDNDPSEQVAVGHTEGASSPIHVPKVEIISADSVIGDDVTVNHGTTVADKKPLLGSLDEEQKYQPQVVVNNNTNKRFNKRGKPTTMRMEASEFGDKLKTRKMTYGKRKKDWICEVCGKGFTTLASLKGHNAMQHKAGDAKTFTCDICHKVLSAKSLLEAHKRKHTGERPFACDVCTNTYKRATDLRHHILVAHMGKRPFACDLCSKTFTVRNALRDHKLSHQGIKPHKCTACGKSFCQSSSLRTHMRKHTGLRPWMCQYCGKDFSDQSSFTRHQRMHTGEKPFQCEHCPCTFARTEQLKKHLSKEHPEDLQNLATLAAAVASIV